MPKQLWNGFAQLAGLLIMCINALEAQPFSFRHFSVGQGLPGYSVLSITQDKRGFIWLGTTDGLCRYDGARFKIYKKRADGSSSVTNNNILSLFADTKGNVWAGTSGGLNKYNEKKDVFENISLNGKKDGHIFTICEDAKANIWIGSSNGLIRLNDQKSTPVLFYSNNTVKAVFEDSQGKIWVGSEKGVSFLERKNTGFVMTALNQLLLNPYNAPQNITTIAEDASHNIWIGTESNGVFCFNPASRSLVHHQANRAGGSGLINNNIRRIFLDRSKALWIGTQEGISIINPYQQSFLNIEHNATDKTSLSQNSVYSIFQDNNGSIWVGTYFGGVNLCYAYNTRFFTIQNKGNTNSISNNVISSIVEDKQNNLWIGTEGGGLNMLDEKTGYFSIYKHHPNFFSTLGSNLIKVVFNDKEGNIWVGTHGGGLNALAAGSKVFKRYFIDSSNISGSEVTSIAEDRYQNLWVASNSGIHIFKRTGIQLNLLPSKNYPIRGIPRYFFTDSNGDIWIAGSSGIYRIQEKNGFKEIDSAYSVNCFAEDHLGNIWMGTSNNGLLKFDKKNSRLLSDKNLFLRSVNVLGILPYKDGSLWISTRKGLVHYNPATRKYLTYTVNDGIAGNEFNYNSFLKSAGGRFYFGGFNGITHFIPEEINTNPMVAPIVFTSLSLQNEEVKINGSQKILSENIMLAPPLIFDYDQNLFTIEFALLNYIKGEKNIYQYKLEGFDKDWKETPDPSVTYTNLPSGSYILKVKGANNDGFWSKTASLQIRVNPPFWFTWWAYCLYVLAAAAIVFIIARFFFLREVLKKEDELHQAKLNFFTNASHEIRTHLTLIMAPVERLLSENKKESFIQQQLTQVKSNTNRLLNLVSELMDFRKAETNHLRLNPTRQNLISFLQDIYESFREMSQSKNIHMSFVHDKDVVALNFDEQQLEKVFFNLLANAFKFTPEGGLIQLHVITRSNDVIIKVTDNGRGIAPQYIDKLFTNFFQVADHGLQNTGYGIGLALSKNIVALHKGTISVESSPAQNDKDGQTVFTVTLPLNAKLIGVNKNLPTSSKPAVNTSVTIIDTPTEANLTDISVADRKTILIVEDNAELRQLVKDTLSQRFDIIIADNGSQGWEAACAEIPDLIISDVMMPEMDGYTLCQKIKTDERTSHIPVILLTAKSSQNEQVTGLEQGADLYLTKPFSTKVLTLSVLNLLAAQEKLKQKITRELTTLNTAPADQILAADSMTEVDKAFIEKAISLIDDPAFGVELLSKKVAMSAPVLYKKLRALTDMSVNEFIKLHRFKKAATLLQQTDMTVNEVSFAVGYDDRKYFSREFKKYFHMTPSEFSSKSKN